MPRKSSSRLLKFDPSKSSDDEDEASNYRHLMEILADEEEQSQFHGFIHLILLFILTKACLLATFAFSVPSLKTAMEQYRVFINFEGWDLVTQIAQILSALFAIHLLTRITISLIEWRFKLERYTLFFTRGLGASINNLVWSALVFLGWLLWLQPYITLRLREVRRGRVHLVEAMDLVTQTLLALLIGSVLWLIKNVLFLKLDADLHYHQFFYRIRHTVLDLHGIKIIGSRGGWKFVRSKKKRKGDEEGRNVWMEVAQLREKTVPIWLLKRLTDLYLDHMEKSWLHHRIGEVKDDQKVIREARRMLQEVVCDHQRNYILPEDLKKYNLTPEEEDSVFRCFMKKKDLEQTRDHHDRQDQDLDNNQEEFIPRKGKVDHERKIVRERFFKWAVRAYKNCWGLKQSLVNSESAFVQLNQLLSALVIIVVAIMWLLLTKTADTNKIAFALSPFLAATFIFGESCKHMFEGIIFAFIMHPFDIGDRIVVDGMQMMVREINILTTVLYKYDTEEMVVYPNAVLVTKNINNFETTPDRNDMLEFTVDAKTPLKKIKELELKIKEYLDGDPKFSRKSHVVIEGFGKEIKMAVYFKYLVSYLDSETKAVRKSEILSKTMEFLEELGIQTTSCHEIYIRNISSLERLGRGRRRLRIYNNRLHRPTTN